MYGMSAGKPLGLSLTHASEFLARHNNPSLKLVHEVGMALSDLDYIPLELNVLLENIVGKTAYDKNAREYGGNAIAYEAFYEYLIGTRVRNYL
jgi:hypothetical protein